MAGEACQRANAAVGYEPRSRGSVEDPSAMNPAEMPQEGKRKRPRLSPVKRIAFAAAALCLFFGLAEGVLRLLGVAPGNGDLALSRGFSRAEPLFEGGAKQGTVRTRRLPKALFGRELLNPAEFEAVPPAGSVRILCFGGSAVYGWPYDGRRSFTAWLRAGLAALPGGDRVEILNFGVPGYGSRRVANIVEEALAFHPSLVFVMTGNNELLETRFGEAVLRLPLPLLDAHLFLLAHVRCYAGLNRLARAVLRPARSRPGIAPGAEGREPYPLPRRWDPRRARLLSEAFRANLERIRRACRAEGVPLVLAVPPVNLKDTPPVGAFPFAGRPVPEPRLARLAAQHPEDADLQYRYGRALLRRGDAAGARTALAAACDRDPCGLRVTRPLAEVMRRVARSEGVELLDLPAVFARAAKDGIPGNDLFLDNCHPNDRGHALIALAFARLLAARGILRTNGEWEEAFTGAVKTAQAAASLTPEDRVHYWRFRAAYLSLHGDRKGAAEAEARAAAWAEKGGAPEGR